MGFRFLHASDIHLLDLEGVGLQRYLNKRATGRLNMALSRHRKHRAELFDEILTFAEEQGIDRLILTGDLTNLALESEFALVRRKLDAVRMPVTVIPGNHDAYTRGSVRVGRFERYLMHHMEGEREGDNIYPFVMRHEDVAFIGVSTAIATLPLYATGRVGDEQLGRLEMMLERTGSEGLVRVVLIHHPVTPGVSRARHDLLDLAHFGQVIARAGAELVLHGHEHRVVESELPGPEGSVPVHGISSSTMLSTESTRTPAFSIYSVEEGRIERELYRWTGESFVLA